MAENAVIFKQGDRVEICGGPFKGRHGVVIGVHAFEFRDLLRTSVNTETLCDVKTDAGRKLSLAARELRRETASQTGDLVPDIEIEGAWYTPEETWQLIGSANKYAATCRARADRARKAGNKAVWQAEAAKSVKRAAVYRAAFYHWAARYPQAACEITRHSGQMADLARYYHLQTIPAMTALQEEELQALERRLTAIADKWAVGDGVAYRVASQINRGFRIAELDREQGLARLAQVADTGITTSGGADRLEDRWVHIGDLVRDRRHDLPSRAAPSEQTPVQVAANPSEQPPPVSEAAPGKLVIKPYSDKAILLAGDTRAHLAEIKALRAELGLRGGWVPGAGWVFPARHEQILRQRFAQSLPASEPGPTEGEDASPGPS